MSLDEPHLVKHEPRAASATAYDVDAKVRFDSLALAAAGSFATPYLAD